MQEVRELAMRGVDGPGMHILDLLPDSYAGVEGAVVGSSLAPAEHRRQLADALAACLPAHHLHAEAACAGAPGRCPGIAPTLTLMLPPVGACLSACPPCHLPAGVEEAKAERRAVLQGMLARPPKVLLAWRQGTAGTHLAPRLWRSRPGVLPPA